MRKLLGYVQEEALPLLRAAEFRASEATNIEEGGKMREWLVIEDSRQKGVFMDPALLNPTGYIPRDVAERVLGRRLDGNQWFTREDSALMRAQPEWTTNLDLLPLIEGVDHAEK